MTGPRKRAFFLRPCVSPVPDRVTIALCAFLHAASGDQRQPPCESGLRLPLLGFATS